MLDSEPLFALDLKIKEVESKIKEKLKEKESKKKKKSKSSKQSEILDNGSSDPETLAVDDDGAKGKSRQLLLGSIAAFLEGNGFHKTVAVFRSEAQLEDDSLKASSIEFEGLFYKFVGSRRNSEDTAINCEKEKDSQKTDASSEDGLKHVQKKRRKHKREPDDGTNPILEEHSSNKNSNGTNNLGNPSDIEKLNSAEDLNVGIKDKKKKLHYESLEENADKDDSEINDGVAKESDKNDKSKKKKKHEISLENNGSEDHKEKFLEIVEEKIAELKSLTNLSSSLAAESNAKHKGEKKKKRETKAISGSLDVKGNKSSEEARKESESVEEKTAKSENSDELEKKAHKKRKRLDSEEQVSQVDDETMAEESKHVKLEGAENNKECWTPYKADKSPPDNEQITVNKKRKTEKSSKNSDEACRTSQQKQNPSDQSVQKESEKNQLGNGDLEKIGKEGGTALKSQKKEKCSAEPKTVNAFQRVKIDEVKFADERLQDNSYWALDDTGSGYGAKAQEVLGQVRGR